MSDSFVTPWTHRQEYWSGLPFPSPGDLPDPGIEPRSPALEADALPSEPPGKPQQNEIQSNKPNGDSQLTFSFTNNLYPVNLGSTKKEDEKKTNKKQGKLKKTNKDSLLPDLTKNLKFRKTFFTSLKRRISNNFFLLPFNSVYAIISICGNSNLLNEIHCL